MMAPLTLFDLNSQVRGALQERFTEPVWVTAEITEIQYNSSGHCYLQLADKREGEAQLTATARATIWAFTYRMLKPYFETTTGRSLGRGMKVLVCVEVVFHEVYGYSLNIKDIDPTFTVGDLERKKREILAQLESDGIIDMNRELEFPLLPKHIAVISSPTAAGLGDFMDQLEKNPYGYYFHVKLFPAVMQGEKTTGTVVEALERIYEYESLFDVVVIIRGGGSQTDLGSFDSYELAANVAQFPLPVIAGIGHERDETVVDRVAHMRVKTPTAAAAFLIGVFQEQDGLIEGMKADFAGGVKELIGEQKNRLLTGISAFKRLTEALLVNCDTRLAFVSQRLGHLSRSSVSRQQTGFGPFALRIRNTLAIKQERRLNRLDGMAHELRRKSGVMLKEQARCLEVAETVAKYADPRKILERGYSVTRLNGKAVKDVRTLVAGDVLETTLAEGVVRSVVEDRKKI